MLSLVNIGIDCWMLSTRGLRYWTMITICIISLVGLDLLERPFLLAIASIAALF